MIPAMPSRPSLVAHADWGSAPAKRWVAVAHAEGPLYAARAPEPVGELGSFLARLRNRAEPGGAVFLGFDFPIGLPRAYAERAGIDSFRRALAGFGGRFYDPAERPEEIAPERPFYPGRPGSAARRHLLEGLGVPDMDTLLRRCDRATGKRPAASPLFWTLGPKAVGKAAIVGWRDVLAPALRGGDLDVALWPFDGALEELFEPGRIVVAETYPRELYDQLGIRFGGKRKGDEGARAAAGARLGRWATETGVRLDEALSHELEHGFPGANGDDRFDAAVGLFGMLNVALKRRLSGEPDDPAVRTVEGWILGQGGGVEAAPPAPAARGWSFSSLEELGEGPGFRKIRSALGIAAFGANALVIPPGVVGRPHWHREQDELYFVHRGRARFSLPGETRELGPGGLCHVESTTPRQVTSVGEEPLVLLVVGAKGGYVGRDGQLADPSKLG